MKNSMADKKPTYVEGVGWRYETEHSMQRRMMGHDYQSRCIYMITITTEGRRPVLGKLRWTAGHPEDAHVERTVLGNEVAKCWAAIESHYHGVEAFPLMVMPDHVHGLLFVRREMECHLGQIVKGFKIGCTHAMWEMEDEALSASNYNSTDRTRGCGATDRTRGSDPAGRTRGSDTADKTVGNASPDKAKGKRKGLFTSGYQDSVLSGKGQLNHMISYIAQNPYRLAMKREKPDLFRVVGELKIGDMSFAAIGNRWLLDRPVRMQVRCHNNKRPENLDLIQKQKEYFLRRGSKGGVIVSPCISEGEREIARAALEAKMPLIVILENGFPPMYKPPGRYFDACADGVLLMLAPWPYHTEKRVISRAQCLSLNAMAHEISSEPWTEELEKELMR